MQVKDINLLKNAHDGWRTFNWSELSLLIKYECGITANKNHF